MPLEITKNNHQRHVAHAGSLRLRCTSRGKAGAQTGNGSREKREHDRRTRGRTPPPRGMSSRTRNCSCRPLMVAPPRPMRRPWHSLGIWRRGRAGRSGAQGPRSDRRGRTRAREIARRGRRWRGRERGIKAELCRRGTHVKLKHAHGPCMLSTCVKGGKKGEEEKGSDAMAEASQLQRSAAVLAPLASMESNTLCWCRAWAGRWGRRRGSVWSDEREAEGAGRKGSAGTSHCVTRGSRRRFFFRFFAPFVVMGAGRWSGGKRPKATRARPLRLSGGRRKRSSGRQWSFSSLSPPSLSLSLFLSLPSSSPTFGLPALWRHGRKAPKGMQSQPGQRPQDGTGRKNSHVTPSSPPC